MTTNTNPSRNTAARFFASPDASHKGKADRSKGWPIVDRTDDSVVGYAKGRAAARDLAAILTAFAPEPQGPRPMPAKGKGKATKATKAEAKAKADANVRTSHVDCAHVSTKLARAICRRERAKASHN